MTWFKVDDGILTNEKFAALAEGPCRADAIALWVMAGAWSSHALKNGLVPRGVVASLGFDSRAPSELVRVGLWELADAGAHEFHDWADYNPSAAQVQAKRKAAATRKARHRARLSEVQEVTDDVAESRRDNTTVTRVERSENASAARDRDLDLNSSSQILEIAPARVETFVPDRKPLPETPVTLQPSEAAQRIRLAQRIETYLSDQGKRLLGKRPKPMRRHALELAAWALDPESQEDWNLSAEALAKKVCDGLLMDERAQKEGCPLAYASRNPVGYLGGLKPLHAPQARTSNVWREPEWMRAGDPEAAQPESEQPSLDFSEMRELGLSTLARLHARQESKAAAQ